MNIFGRLISLLRRFASYFVTGLENSEPVESQFDAASRIRTKKVKTGINDFEIAAALVDDIEDELESTQQAVNEAQARMDERNRAASNAEDRVAALKAEGKLEEAEEAQNDADNALIDAAAAAEDYFELSNLLADLKQDLRDSNVDLRNMKNMLRSMDRQRMKGSGVRNVTLIKDRLNRTRRNFTAIKEGYLGLGDDDNADELEQRAVDRVRKESNRAKRRDEMVSSLLEQRGKLANQQPTLRPEVARILEESKKRVGYTPSNKPETTDQADQAGK